MTQLARCDLCRFWQSDKDDTDRVTGVCRYNAPVAGVRPWSQADNSYEDWPRWPVTLDKEWCGKFERGPSLGAEATYDKKETTDGSA